MIKRSSANVLFQVHVMPDVLIHFADKGKQREWDEERVYEYEGMEGFCSVVGGSYAGIFTGGCKKRKG